MWCHMLVPLRHVLNHRLLCFPQPQRSPSMSINTRLCSCLRPRGSVTLHEGAMMRQYRSCCTAGQGGRAAGRGCGREAQPSSAQGGARRLPACNAADVSPRPTLTAPHSTPAALARLLQVVADAALLCGHLPQLVQIDLEGREGNSGKLDRSAGTAGTGCVRTAHKREARGEAAGQ